MPGFHIYGYFAELFEMSGTVNGQGNVRKNSLAIIINGANLTRTNRDQIQ